MPQRAARRGRRSRPWLACPPRARTITPGATNDRRSRHAPSSLASRAGAERGLPGPAGRGSRVGRGRGDRARDAAPGRGGVPEPRGARADGPATPEPRRAAGSGHPVKAEPAGAPKARAGAKTDQPATRGRDAAPDGPRRAPEHRPTTPRPDEHGPPRCPGSPGRAGDGLRYERLPDAPPPLLDGVRARPRPARPRHPGRRRRHRPAERAPARRRPRRQRPDPRPPARRRGLVRRAAGRAPPAPVLALLGRRRAGAARRTGVERRGVAHAARGPRRGRARRARPARLPELVRGAAGAPRAGPRRAAGARLGLARGARTDRRRGEGPRPAAAVGAGRRRPAVVFGGLFATADPAFADLLGSLVPDVAAAPEHPGASSSLSWALAGALAVAHTAAAPTRWDGLGPGRDARGDASNGRCRWSSSTCSSPPSSPSRPPSCSRGDDEVLAEQRPHLLPRTPGKGFWQLLFATVLTLAVISRRRTRRAPLGPARPAPGPRRPRYALPAHPGRGRLRGPPHGPVHGRVRADPPAGSPSSPWNCGSAWWSC